jgi:hypothetical protein
MPAGDKVQVEMCITSTLPTAGNVMGVLYNKL